MVQQGHQPNWNGAWRPVCIPNKSTRGTRWQMWDSQGGRYSGQVLGCVSVTQAWQETASFLSSIQDPEPKLYLHPTS